MIYSCEHGVSGVAKMSDEEAAVASEGSLKWYNAEKGYGFIESPVGDVFLHIKELRKSGVLAVADGAMLAFMRNKGPKGLFATGIKVLQNDNHESKAEAS